MNGPDTELLAAVARVVAVFESLGVEASLVNLAKRLMPI